MSTEKHAGEAGERTEESHIELPAPTAWPMVFAIGLTFVMAGLLLHWAVSVVGLIIFFQGAFGWWRTVIPHEEHEEVPIDLVRRPTPIMVEQRSVVRMKVGEGRHRALVPEKIHPYSAGIWGGLAGGAAMAFLACAYGLFVEHSLWYPINLLAGVVIPGLGTASLAQLKAFNGLAFVAASVGHVTISILVGIIYAVMLPMFPKFAPLWAGILMPIFWSGMIATTLGLVNPALNERISWPWFVACQLGYGLVGGFFIARSTSISTMKAWGFAERAFVEAPGLVPPREEE